MDFDSCELKTKLRQLTSGTGSSLVGRMESVVKIVILDLARELEGWAFAKYHDCNSPKWTTSAQ